MSSYKHLSHSEVSIVHNLTDVQKIEAMNLLTTIRIMHLEAENPDDISDTIIAVGNAFLKASKPVKYTIHKLIYDHMKFIRVLFENEGQEAVRDEWTDWDIVIRNIRDDISTNYSLSLLYREYGVSLEEVQGLWKKG